MPYDESASTFGFQAVTATLVAGALTGLMAAEHWAVSLATRRLPRGTRGLAANALHTVIVVRALRHRDDFVAQAILR